jgi:integrase/recombinase XerD
MIKRRARAAGPADGVSRHTFRATGITVYVEGGGTVEKSKQIASHESPSTTELYDRSLKQIKKIRI